MVTAEPERRTEEEIERHTTDESDWLDVDERHFHVWRIDGDEMAVRRHYPYSSGSSARRRGLRQYGQGRFFVRQCTDPRCRQ